jgi:glycosyltransferase involved in cell wall biosynthesis
MARPLKVLLVSSHPVQYAVPLYRLYAEDPRLDITVAFCSLQGAEAMMDPEFGIELKWDVPLLAGYRWVHPRNLSPRPRLTSFLGLVNPGLWSLTRRGHFDIVVCFGWRAASFWIAGLAAKTSGAALVLTSDAHTIEARDGARFKTRLKRFLIPRILGLANAVWVPSSRSAQFVASLGLGTMPVHLVPYVVDTGFFAERARIVDRAAVRSRWGVPPEAFVALFVGKLVPWKRPFDLIRALQSAPDCWAVFAGDGSLRAELEAEADRLGVLDRCRFLGFANQTELPAVYAASDILVLPSAHEPFGLVVNEAFACGIPAIVSEACGAAGDLIREGETGFVVGVGDVESLANRLRALERDRQLLREMSARARARVDDWGPAQNCEAFARACLSLRGEAA